MFRFFTLFLTECLTNTGESFPSFSNPFLPFTPNLASKQGKFTCTPEFYRNLLQKNKKNRDLLRFPPMNRSISPKRPDKELPPDLPDSWLHFPVPELFLTLIHEKRTLLFQEPGIPQPVR
jgi:hypothetical protein